MLKTDNIEYRDGEVILEGYYAYDATLPHKKPAVLIVHDWSGKTEFVCQKAKKLAELGYVGFAVDMYGKGKIGHTKEEKSALMQPLIHNRANLLKRIEAAFATVKTLEPVDSNLIGAIGFCFGGLCVLDLVRSGADVKAVVSFHGALTAPENSGQSPIKAKILALHGFDDPLVTTDHVIAFCNEMTHKKVDWQFHMYGNAMHSFTNPEANDPNFGTVYHKLADDRSWIAMKDFFKESFITK